MYQLGSIAEAILNYLWNHPNAQDTRAGITEWWLPKEPFELQTAKVKEALRELVDRGLVLQIRGGDSQIRYRINRRRFKEIEAMLKRTTS